MQVEEQDKLIAAIIATLRDPTDFRSLVDDVRPGAWPHAVQLSATQENAVKAIVNAAMEERWIRDLVARLAMSFPRRSEFAELLAAVDNEGGGQGGADHVTQAPVDDRQKVADLPSGPPTTAGIRPLNPEELSRFRALFTVTRGEIARLHRYKALHDALQGLERTFNAIRPQHKRLRASPEAWDELRSPLDDLVIAIQEVLGILTQDDRLNLEFGDCQQRLGDAAVALRDAMAGEPRKLDIAVVHIAHVVGTETSSANNRLIATARELQLDKVVAALRAVLEHPEERIATAGAETEPGPSGSMDKLRQLVRLLGELHATLEARVDEHDCWQAIDNELRKLVEVLPGLVATGEIELDETPLSWPLVRRRLQNVLAGGASDSTREIAAAAKQLDDALADQEHPSKRLPCLRSMFRRCNARFLDVDKQLLRTCEQLEQVGDKLDFALEVIR